MGKQTLSSDLSHSRRLHSYLAADHSYSCIATLPQLSPLWTMPLPQLNLDGRDYNAMRPVMKGNIRDHQGPSVPYRWSRVEV